jgi:trehalose 2-sulfotransferase
LGLEKREQAMSEQAGSYQPRIRHVVRRLYDREADFNCFGRAPVGTYMLATIPRSGSTYCAIRLWQTGLLGAPMEYLNFRIMGDLFHRLGYKAGEDGLIPPAQIEDYWADTQRLRTSPNGVFGYKMFTTNYVEIAQKYPDFLQQVTPNYVIYLIRRDLLGQAMSYSRAQRSKVWFADVQNAPEVEYNYQHIKYCMKAIENQRQRWEAAFTFTGVEPIRIYYEDLMARSEATISTILSEMGIKEDSDAAIDVPMINRQTDGVSRDWRERFLEDSARDTEHPSHVEEAMSL